jgi:hypothetical protein
VGTIATTLRNDVESGPAGFTQGSGQGTPGWQIRSSSFAHSPIFVFFSPDTTSAKDDYLFSPFVSLPAGGVLSFWHTYGFEAGRDGAVIEITTNGGATWTDLGPFITTGGYTGTISSGTSPLGGRMAWTGGTTGAMREVVVDLSAFSGLARLRWRLGCDSSGGGAGWFIDDVTIATTGCSPMLAASDPTPAIGRSLTLTVTGEPDAPVDLLLATAVGRHVVTLPGGRGMAQSDLAPPVGVRASWMTDGSGVFTLTQQVPNRGHLVGRTFKVQAVVSAASGEKPRTNVECLTVTSP